MLSRGWTGKLAATFLVSILGVAALPSSYAGFALDDVRRPIYRGNVRTRDLKTDTEVIVKSDISVAGAEDGRAVSSTPTTSTPIGESLKMVTKQLLQAPSATDMVATDVRTPPRVKSTQKVNADVFVPLGKGEAMPIVMEDPSSYEIVTAPSPKSSTQSQDGISTWILLSNGEQTTASNKKKPSVAPTADPKKETPKNPPLPVAEKFTKKEDTTAPKPLLKPVASTKKQNVTKEEPAKGSLVLQDSKFKNRTPVVVGRVPAPQNKTDSTKKATTATITTVSTTPTTRRKPISVSPTNPTKYVPEIVPTTSLVVASDPIGTVEETSTTTEASNSTKRTRRPGTKKKKKNKNRRKRPTKDNDSAESKIQETSVASNKIQSKNPISTSIYNYLAREVMPSVGVGIVGLVLTAGLAGLFLYPFGGGIARRNYDKGTGSMHDHHNMYYYNSYAPHPEKEQSNAQPEEKVFGQVLTSMSQSAYSTPFDSTKYTTSNNKYRYDMHDFGNVNGYAGVSEYSTLPESVKNGDYEPMKDYNPHEKSKEDSYASALTASQESSKNDYSPEIKSSDYMPDSSKYYSMDPVSSHYKLTDGSPSVDKYSTFTEYTSYTNPAAVGTSYQPENKTDVSVDEDKSDKSQPQFSALVGSPQFTNTDFVGSVSLTGSYGAQEVHHRTGALASDHGPRSLKHEESKNRKRRDVHDDFSNEIYSNDKSTKSPPSSTESTSEPSAKESTTTEISTEIPQTSAPETTFNPDERISSTEKTKQEVFTESPVPDSNNSGGILGFISRLAQLKLQLGINILKSTGEAFQRYLNTMAKRMETAIRTVDKRRRSYQTWLKHENKREKRSAYQRRIHKRFKQH